MEYQERIKKGGNKMSIPACYERIDPPDEETFICPVCEREITYGTMLFFNEDNDCVGCEECLHTKYVEDYQEEQDYFKGGAI